MLKQADTEADAYSAIRRELEKERFLISFSGLFLTLKYFCRIEQDGLQLVDSHSFGAGLAVFVSGRL